MFRRPLPATVDPARPAQSVLDDDPRKIVVAFVMAMTLYLGVAFGTVVQEKIALDDNHDAWVATVEASTDLG